jgi:hypothetical protein
MMQLLKNFPQFYGTRRFITVFIRALQLVPILSQIDQVHTIPSYRGSCEYLEEAVAESGEGVIHQLGGWAWG